MSNVTSQVPFANELLKEMTQRRLVAASGMASEDNVYYDLSDSSSYIVKAITSTIPELFYSHYKRLFYLANASGSYMVCFHYPVSSFWTEENVQLFKIDIMPDIMETEPALFRDFAIQLLGGIKQ